MSAPLPYWASETDSTKLIARCLERHAWHIKALTEQGRMRRMASMLSAYYGRGTDGWRDTSRLLDAGEQGEVIEWSINTVKPIIQNSLSLIAGQKAAVKPVARNGDSKAQAQTRLAMQLNEVYERQSHGEELLLQTILSGILASSWSYGQSWMPKDGAEWGIDPDTNAIQYEGDLAEFGLPPWRTVYDFAAQEESQRRWVLFRRPVARFDLAARIADQDAAEKVRTMSGDSSKTYVGGTSGNTAEDLRDLDGLMGESLPEEDVVWVWELRHLPTPALPAGRVVRFIEPDVVLFDSADVGYPYDKGELHVYEYAPERVGTSMVGHTYGFDLLGIQEFVDMCTASMASTVNSMGAPKLWQPRNEGGPEVQRLGSASILTTNVKPEWLEVPMLSPEVLTALEWAMSQARQAASLNDTVMGQPDKGMPASAQALQRAQAQQYHQGAQAWALNLKRRTVNGRLKLMKRFAKAPRIAEIAGPSNKYELREWTSDSIEAVERFDVEPVNPMSQSFEGRQAIAEQLHTMGLLKDGEDFLAFLETGSLERITNSKKANLELVEANKALLLKGVGLPPVDQAQSMAAGMPVFVDDGQEHVRILKSDPHHLAIPLYLSVANSPASRDELKLVQAAVDAATESARLWQSLTLDECVMYGIPPLPSHTAPPPEAIGMPPGKPPAGAPKPPPTDGVEPASKLPAPPRDPLTGDQPPPSDTGLQPAGAPTA